MYYIFIQNNKINGKGQCKCLNLECIDVSQDIYDNIEKYIYQDGKIVLNPNYEQEQKREMISNLELTAADVERAIYTAKNMDFEDLIEMVSSLEIEGLDIKRLKIELKANHFIRKHPYIDIVGGLLGYSSEDMDYLFENKEFPTK